MKNQKILSGIPKVYYGGLGCTPFPLCLQACAAYLDIPVNYTQAMVESGAAFRFVWDTSCWNGGNVDVLLGFDNPVKVFECGLRSIGCGFKMLGRTKEATKSEFVDFIRSEIDSGYPVIALGIIGPGEACVVAGYRDNGETLLGWNVFQEYPEYQSSVRFADNGYFITSDWWDNPGTRGLFATSRRTAQPFVPIEILRNAAEALTGRMDGSYAKGLYAYDAWKDALLCERDFPESILLPALVERMMCHGDAMDCLLDGRGHAMLYLRELAQSYPAQALKLTAAAGEFECVKNIIWNEMIPVLGSCARGEHEMLQLAKQETRTYFAGLIDQMKAHDQTALKLIHELIREFS